MLLIRHSVMLNFTSLSKSPEGGGSEGVSDGGVDGIVVSPVVAAGQQPQLEDLEHPGAQDDRQPLVVGDVLDHGPDVSPAIISVLYNPDQCQSGIQCICTYDDYGLKKLYFCKKAGNKLVKSKE